MKNYLFGIIALSIFLLPLSSANCMAQDSSYKTTPIENIKYKKFQFLINYISIENNFNKPNTSDTSIKESILDQYMNFARSTPSYKFYIIKETDTLFSITYLQNNDETTTFDYEVTNLHKKQTQLIRSNVWGNITEKRVDEMLLKKYDPKAKKGAIAGTNPRQFLFNEMLFGYQDYEKLKIEAIELMKGISKKI